MEIRALTPAEQKYTYTQSMQLEGQQVISDTCVEILHLLGMAFTLLGLIQDRNGKRTSLRKSLTRLSIRFVRTRDFCTTAMI